MNQWRLGHRPALDGLRGVAVALVVLCHVGKNHLDSWGPVGVTMFFALSGFLITSLLLEERRDTGRVSFGGFYLRRARRLMPAVLVYLAIWTVAGHFINKVEFHVTRADLAGALFYFQNWRIATFHHVSWPTAITWSLSIEEQFYLLWPATFLLARRWPRAQVTIAAFGVLFSVMLRVATWDGSGANAWAMYYQSFTRMDSLFIGCLLAFAVHRADIDVPKWLAPGSGAALVAFTAVDNSMLNHIAGPAFIALATCGIIAAACVRPIRSLEFGPLVWLGKRSYALYLWHYPIVTLVGEGHGLLAKLLGIALSLVAAELSWRLVEKPIKNLRLQRRQVPVTQPAT